MSGRLTANGKKESATKRMDTHAAPASVFEPLEPRLQLSAGGAASLLHSFHPLPVGGMSEISVGNTAIFYDSYLSPNSAPTGAVEIYDAVHRRWSSASLSTPRSRMTVGTQGTMVIFAGGLDNSNEPSNRVEIYDSRRHVWSAATLSQARIDMAVATVGHLVFFAGGESASHVPSDVVDIYNTRRATWTTARLSQARTAITQVVVANTLVLAGGVAAGTTINAVDVFNLQTEQWSNHTLMNGGPSIRTAVVGAKILFLGTDRQQIGALNLFDTTTGRWSTAALSQTRAEFSVAVQDGKALIAGGRIYPANDDFSGASRAILSDAVDVYDAHSNRWSATKLSAARGRPDVVTAGGVVMFVGGNEVTETGVAAVDVFNDSDAVDVYKPHTGRWTAGKLSAARYVHGIANGHRVIFAGGVFYAGVDAIDVYNIQNGHWSAAKLLHGRFEIAQANLGSLSLFAGGVEAYLQHPVADVDVYDSRTGLWSTTSLTEPVGVESDVVIGRQAIFYGNGTVVDIFSRK